jgi:nitrate reductase gamma subunit
MNGANMIELLLFVVLPYLALIICIGGSIYRARTQALTYSALSSQFLENRSLVWGSLPWHIGILAILLGHFIALFFPGFWQSVVSFQPLLIGIETIGLALAIGCLVGLIVLLVRRVTSSKVQAVTSPMDMVVLVLLLLQVGLGIGIATAYRWGASWSVGTMTPYIWSILTFQPNTSYITDLPVMAKMHIVGAWLLVLIVPFSRLIHMFALPIAYLMRPPQNVVWTTPQHAEAAASVAEEDEARRYFLRGAVAAAAGGFLLSVGTLDKAFRFFFGPRLTKQEEGEIMSTRLQRLEATAEQRKLELERQQTNFILVANLSELSDTTGKYFIDYQMRPAMAFKGADGLPNLLSAKCTHLGCTVGNQVNDQGKILCPCHVSFFDVKSGQPNAEAPAKAPLPHLPWAVMDTKGTILVSRDAAGNTKGTPDPKLLADARVYIVNNEGSTT